MQNSPLLFFTIGCCFNCLRSTAQFGLQGGFGPSWVTYKSNDINLQKD
jgi:hypothetical protein